MVTYTDPRGAHVTAVAILPTVTLNGECNIFGDVRPITMSCGHTVYMNPCFSYRVGDRHYCLQCTKGAK